MRDENGFRGWTLRKEAAKNLWRELHQNGASVPQFEFWMKSGPQVNRIENFDLVCLRNLDGSFGFWGLIVAQRIPGMLAPGIGPRAFKVEKIPASLTPERAIELAADPFPIYIDLFTERIQFHEPCCPLGVFSNENTFDIG